MRDELTILKSKESREFIRAVNAQWGASWKPEDCFVRNRQDKYFLITRELAKVKWETLRLSSVGLYVGEMHDDAVRLSVEGSQIVGPSATKNVIDVDHDAAMRWLKGDDIAIESKDGEFKGHVIVKMGKDFMGTGAYKEGHLINHVPKARRLPENA
jgi:NOL1/NOP2/fmu family ribosome biogenesis protein